MKPRLSRDDSKPLFRTGLNQCVQRQSGEDRLVPLRALTSNTLRNGNERVNRNGTRTETSRPRVERDTSRPTAVWCSVQRPFFLISSFPVSKNVAARLGDTQRECGDDWSRMGRSKRCAFRKRRSGRQPDRQGARFSSEQQLFHPGFFADCSQNHPLDREKTPKMVLHECLEREPGRATGDPSLLSSPDGVR